MLDRFLKQISLNILTILSLPLSAVPALNTISYNGAGVLPLYTKNDKQYAIVAREAHGRDKGTYDSFAGSRDLHEHNPTVTAAREAAEEMISHQTMRLSVPQIKKYIDPYKNHTTMVLVDQKSKYVLYVTKFDMYIHKFLCTFYSALSKTHNFKYKEKDRIAIVTWYDLKQAILQNKAQVCAEVFDPITNKSQRCMITLRPILIKSLRPMFRGDSYQQGKNKKVRYY